MSIVIIGAGLAGLSCALKLQQSGHDVVVLEASDRVGGRMGSRKVDGHIIDRGFQVLFTHYPMIQELVDVKALQPHTIDAGAIVRVTDRFYDFSNPLQDHNPMGLWKTIRAPFITWKDKLLVGKLTLELASATGDKVLHGRPLGSMREYLENTGFSESFIENFVRPFFGGIFLTQDMTADARIFRFYWKMLVIGVAGSVVLPEDGMQAVPDQLAGKVGWDHIRLNTKVAELHREDGRVRGVVLDSGEIVMADAVAIAGPYPEAKRLAKKLPVEFTGHGTVNLYFESPNPLINSKRVILNGNHEGMIDLVCQISNVNPNYAPPGKHQIAIQLLENPDMSDDRICKLVQNEVKTWVPDHDVSAWKPLEVVRIAFGQYDQDVAVMEHLPGARIEDGLYLASEMLYQSSYEGALRGGKLAACAIGEDLGALVEGKREMARSR